MNRAERLKLLTHAHTLCPIAEGRFDKARVRVVVQEDEAMVVFCAVDDSDGNLLASAALPFTQLDTINSQLAMNYVYDAIIGKLIDEIEERYE